MDQDSRPICKVCKAKPAAINYYRYNKVYYRSKCEHCLNAKKRPAVSSWRRAGYKLKLVCDKCGFKAIDKRQMTVFYIDGDLRNNNWTNLRSICSNCAVEIGIKGLEWKEDPIKPDF